MNYTNYTKAQIAAACLKFGPILDQYLDGTDDGTGQRLVGSQLLFAIAGQESDFGANCHPRHEPAYDWGGRYAQEAVQSDLLRLYGSDAACSWGPWQVMACNALGFRPSELANDLDHAAIAAVGYLKRYVLGAQKARTLAQIADTYNSGNWRDKNVPTEYVARVRHFYLTEVIAAASAAGA